MDLLTESSNSGYGMSNYRKKVPRSIFGLQPPIFYLAVMSDSFNLLVASAGQTHDDGEPHFAAI